MHCSQRPGGSRHVHCSQRPTRPQAPLPEGLRCREHVGLPVAQIAAHGKYVLLHQCKLVVGLEGIGNGLLPLTWLPLATGTPAALPVVVAEAKDLCSSRAISDYSRIHGLDVLCTAFSIMSRDKKLQVSHKKNILL